jgi:hypothetical protein
VQSLAAGFVGHHGPRAITDRLKERSTFIESGAILFAAAGTSPVALSDTAPMLSESDPTAVGLGYRANASTVDKAKFPP